MQLLNELKSKSIKSAVIRLIAAIIGAAGIFAVMGFLWGSHQLITGPKDLATLRDDELEGAYVYFDVDYIIDSYAFTVPNGSSDVEEYTSAEYMTFTPDQERVMGIWLVRKDDEKYLPEFLDQIYGYMYGEFTDENPAPPVRLTGTMERMDSSSQRLFRQTLKDNGIPEDYALFYMLKTNRMGDVSYWLYYGAFALLALMVVMAIINLVLAITGGQQKAVKKYAEASGNPEGTMARLDTWYANAPVVGKNLYMGSEVFLHQLGPKTKVYDMNQVVWAYKRITRRNGVESGFEVILNTVDGKSKSISLTKKTIDEVMDFIYGNCPNTAIGHTDELARLFKQDPAILRTTAQQQRAGVQAAVAERLEGAAQPDSVPEAQADQTPDA